MDEYSFMSYNTDLIKSYISRTCLQIILKGWNFHQMGTFILLCLVGVLTTFTHLYNPIGFPPGPSNDESIYMRRSMHVLTGQGPQEGSLYDHPYFSQIFLAGALGVIGYPSHLIHLLEACSRLKRYISFQECYWGSLL